MGTITTSVIQLIPGNEPHFNGVGRWSSGVTTYLVNTLGRVGERFNMAQELSKHGERPSSE